MRKILLEYKAESDAVERQGQRLAESKAKSEADEITAENNVKVAELKSSAFKIQQEAELKISALRMEAKLSYEQRKVDLEINKVKALSEIETSKFDRIMEAFGKNTMLEIAKAGPETQAELLKGLGLEGFIMTDGNNPINLFGAAQGLLGVKKNYLN